MAAAAAVGKCVVFITGASRGYGRAMSQLITHNENGILQNAQAGSKIVLMARNLADLEKTKSLIVNTDKRFDITVVSVDLSVADVKSTERVVNETLEECGKDFTHAYLFSNAAVLGDPGKLLPDYNSIEEIQKVFTLNVVSASFLISRFSRYFERSSCFVINTSSLLAIQPMNSTCLYSSSKACMDMFINNLAADCPHIRCLNYAPGPMDTEMARELRDKTGNADTQAYFTKMFSEGTIINPTDSAKKLMVLLQRNEFVNGSHIDFYDV